MYYCIYVTVLDKDFVRTPDLITSSHFNPAMSHWQDNSISDVTAVNFHLGESPIAVKQNCGEIIDHTTPLSTYPTNESSLHSNQISLKCVGILLSVL